MKNLNYKLFIVASLVTLSFNVLSQNWRVGGNTFVQLAGNPPILGTTAGNNNPLFFHTDGLNRMKLNGSLGYAVNGVTSARDGFLLLGANNNTSLGTLYGTANGGPFSLLHLSSGVGAFAQEGGFRSWMRFGITSSHNQDLMWIGQRQTAGLDVTDAMICWADNDREL